MPALPARAPSPAQATARIAALHFYPVKSAAGLPLERAQLSSRGLANDRRWMVVTPQGRFLTQREVPRLALVRPQLDRRELRLGALGCDPLRIPLCPSAPLRERPVKVWRDRCPGLDEGDAAAAWLEAVLQRPCRLVRFLGTHRRHSSPSWTGGLEATVRFADGYPLLVIGAASLADLNTRLGRTLPMNRFRPNLVLEGLPAYAEDRIDELVDGALRLKLVKPCIRCRITTTDQEHGRRDGEEPLRLLRSYRYDPELRGVAFGYNAIVLAGADRALQRGQLLRVRWKPAASLRALGAA